LSDWRIIHDAVLRESNATVLERLVCEAEDAMLLRWQELARGGTGADQGELLEMNRAADDLFRIKAEKLGWPDPLKRQRTADQTLFLYDYDVFSGEPSKEPLWLESVQGFSAAVQKMHQLAAQKPGPYFIFSPHISRVIAFTDSSKSPLSQSVSQSDRERRRDV
jgi:hypothetical protein